MIIAEIHFYWLRFYDVFFVNIPFDIRYIEDKN